MTSAMHPDARYFLDMLEANNAPPLHEQDPTTARRLHREGAKLAASFEPEEVGNIRNIVIPGQGHGLPLRIIEPTSGDPVGVLVWAHGGGFLLGTLDTAEATCRALANATNHLVVSVEYRLAPEHPFPAALEDFIDATTWAAEQLQEAKCHLAIGGASAGGNLATATTLYHRDFGDSPIDTQVLAYPWVSYEQQFPSYTAHDGIFLSCEGLAVLADRYVGHKIHGQHPYAFPLANDIFDNLPPAMVITAEFDPLRDDGFAYRDALADADIPVTHRHFDDMIHGFLGRLTNPEWERAREAVGEIGTFLTDRANASP